MSHPLFEMHLCILFIHVLWFTHMSQRSALINSFGSFEKSLGTAKVIMSQKQPRPLWHSTSSTRQRISHTLKIDRREEGKNNSEWTAVTASLLFTALIDPSMLISLGFKTSLQHHFLLLATTKRQYNRCLKNETGLQHGWVISYPWNAWNSSSTNDYNKNTCISFMYKQSYWTNKPYIFQAGLHKGRPVASQLLCVS